MTALPGDDLVPDPTASATHGITIAAPPEAVWPWIAQLGQDRGGFYTYTWLENLVGCDMANADHIVPAWQHPSVGDVVRLHPDLGLRVARVEEDRCLVLAADGAVDGSGAAVPDQGFDFSWAFVVVETVGGSRLLTRERYAARSTSGRIMTELGPLLSAVMTERMLRGVRQRVQRAAQPG